MFTPTVLKHLSTAAARTPMAVTSAPPLNRLNLRLSEMFQRLSEEPDAHSLAEGLRSIRSRHALDLSEIRRPGTPCRSPEEAFNDYVSRNFQQVLAIAPRLLRMYGEPAARPKEADPDASEHLSMLRSESASSFRALASSAETRQVALVHAAVVDESAHAALGIRTEGFEKAVRELILEIAGFRLSEREALLVREFVHPETSTFNAWRCVENLERTAPHARARAILEPVSQTMLDAVSNAFELGSARATTPLYKGMVTNKRLLEMAPGRSLHLPTPMSTTTRADQSYVGRATAEGKLYDTEFIVHGAEAIDAMAFHPPETLEQREAIMLPQRLRIESVDTRTRVSGARGQPFEVRVITLRKPG